MASETRASGTRGGAQSSGGAAVEHLITTRLKLRHLRLIVALDDHRKLNRAAADMSLSQPAASKMLSEIEKIVGVPLFERLPRGVEPTRYGEALIRRTRTMLAELGQAGEEIAALRSETGGSAAIGTLMAPAATMLPQAISAARERLVELQVTVDIEGSEVLVRRLLDGRLDFAIARLPEGIDPAPFDYEEIGSEPVCLMVRRDHPLAARPSVGVGDLAGRDWVLQPRGSPIRRAVEALFGRTGTPLPMRILTSSSILMMLAMAARSEAIVPLARPVADMFLGSGAFVMLPLDEPIVDEPFGLIRVRDRPLSPAARVLYNLVREQQTHDGVAGERDQWSSPGAMPRP